MGVDVWCVDFGAPERTEGGMQRTLDDHVRAVSDAIAQVAAATGKPVHLAGYSQGGMFAYQAAAYRRSQDLGSVITFGSPVDLHRSLPRVSDQITERIVGGLQRAIDAPLRRIEGLPGFFTSTGFKFLSARKEVAQLVEFVGKLHDRQALEKREAKRLFLGGAGFVAWPGPALRKFVDEIIVANRMQSGGFVIDGKTLTLADIRCPILYMFGDRDTMGRAAAVRGIREAVPASTEVYEVKLEAGHFGLVVGSTALTVTWPTVAGWLRHLTEGAPVPAPAREIVEYAHHDDESADEQDVDEDVDDLEEDDFDDVLGEIQYDIGLAQDVIGKTAHAVWDRLGDVGQDVADYLDNLRWQVPRLTRLRRLGDDTLISMGRTLAEQAAAIPDRTFFLWHGRAFTYADANRRVDAVVRGLVAVGVRPGLRVGVMMRSRPSHLSVVTALSRLGAVAVLLSPETPDAALPRALDAGEVELLVTDPEAAARARASFAGKLCVLGGVGSIDPGRALPPGVIDMETIDPGAVPLPPWYRPDPGRARDLALVFVTSGKTDPPRASRITNRRWAFSALGAAATCTLTTRDTVYCCLPLHHPAGTLVAAGSALVGGARLALASTFDPATFWDDVRRYGVSIVFYAGEMCRRLVDAPPTAGEQNHPVRLFAGSGMRQDVWRRLLDRFGRAGVLEYYASTEASAVLANASGAKVGAVGRPLPGSPELAVAAYDFDADDFARDASGRLVRARIDEPGMLVARLDSSRGIADLAHIAPTRLLRDAFVAGDTWFVTGDVLRVDSGGDFWFVGRSTDLVRTGTGAFPAQRIEDALYTAGGLALCCVIGVPDPASPGHEVPAAICVPLAGSQLDLAALRDAAALLPAHARPRHVVRADAIPLTDGFRPIKTGLAALVGAGSPQRGTAEEPRDVRHDRDLGR
jgi:putative long chain acyl-CoA synthase